MMEFLEVVWANRLATAVSAVGGALAIHLWHRYLQRMVTLRWSVTHETLAMGGDNPTWGRIEILHNGQPVGNLLQWCRVEVENESGSHDLENVTVRLQYDSAGTTILNGGGSLEGSDQWLPLSTSFADEVNRYLAKSPDDQPASLDLHRRRAFRIPVLNRGAKAIFLFLVRPDVPNPTLQVYCEHLHVRIKHRPERPMVFGVVQSHASWTGLSFASVIAVVLAMTLTNIWAAVFIALLLGTFGQLFGVAVIRGWRRLVRAIG